MKTIIISIFANGLLIFSLFSFSKPENGGHNGKCTGSSYCSACSNCSRCGHCGSGGTCGVCSGGSSSERISNNSGQSSHKKKKRSYSDSDISNNNSSLGLYSSSKKKTPVYHYEGNQALKEENLLYTISKTTNLRSGAGKDFPIVETLKLNSKLILLYEKGEWYKVRVYDSGNEGYVYIKNVK